MKALLPLLCCMIGLWPLVHAQQQWYFDNYTQRDGLASDITLHALKDKRGFVWFATRHGLSRYDGLHFKNYPYNPSDTNGIRGRRLYNIVADPQGRIWISMETGVCYYDEAHDNFHYVYFKETNGRWVFMPILAEGHNIWIAANGLGLVRYDQRTQKIYPTPLTERKTNFFITLYKSRAGEIWAGTIHSGLFRYFPKNNHYEEYAHQDPTIEYTEKNHINSITEDKHGNLWLGSEGGGLQYLDLKTRTFQLFYPDQKNLKKPFAVIKHTAFLPSLTGDSVLWCGTFGRGMYTFNLRSRTFSQALRNPPLEKGLVSPFVNYFFLDNQGILWIMTHLGVSKALFGAHQIHSLKLPFLQELGNPYSDNSIFEIKPDVRDSSILWMASWGGGVLKYDFQNQKLLASYLNQSPDVHHWNVRSVCFDKKKRLWAGTENGLFYYDTFSDTFREFKLPPFPQRAEKVIYDIVADSQNNLWVASSSGLLRIDATTQQVRQFSMKEGLLDFVVNRLLLDASQKLWVATRKGLHHFDTQTYKIDYYRHPSTANNDLNVGLGMAFDHKGQLWIAARGGLSVLDVKRKKFRNFGEKQGFNASQCNDLYIDDAQNVWISTQGDLFVYDTKNHSFRSFSVKDGLFGSFMYDRISVVKPNVFVNFIGAVSYFTPQNLLSPTEDAPLAFTSFKVIDQEMPFDRDQTATRPFRIKYQQNVLTFEFSTLDFLNPEKARYSYKLEGFDPNWSALSPKHTVTYTNLDGGEYTFWVRTLNKTGQWNRPIAFKILIEPPFWKTWWFRALAVGVLLGILYIVYRSKLQQERQEAAFRQQRTEAETKALRAQMNPHFVFNCMNTIEYYILSNQSHKASIFLQNFSLLVRNVLENSQFDLIFLSHELETLQLYLDLEKERAEDKFTYQIQLSQSLPLTTQIPPLLLQPFVENAILHGLRHKTDGQGLLLIKLWATTDRLWIHIEDNGVGREAATEINRRQSRKKQSLGMKVTADRIAALPLATGQAPAAFEIEDLPPPHGTRVLINLPLYLANGNENPTALL